MRSMIEGPSSGSNSSCTVVLEGSFEKTRDDTRHGYDVIEKVRLTDGHSEPHRVVDVHNMNVEMIWTFESQWKAAGNGGETYSTRVGSE